MLADDKFKQVIIDSLTYLSAKELADVFAFVIMPNHIHLIWRTRAMNGKETVHGMSSEEVDGYGSWRHEP